VAGAASGGITRPWCTDIPQLSAQAWQAVARQRETFGEAQLAHRLAKYLPDQGQLFLGNSLVVRLMDALGQLPVGYPVYSNRGASGIDGLISTAAGVQRGTRGLRLPSSATCLHCTI
jgi:2-succinyl-5-enolpyruvyl-6-hydroxy-3-cyclohexene-1-carboxylate synthase